MEQLDDLNLEYYSNVEPIKVDWLWYPYIPYGKVTLVQGDPGEGKSTFVLNVAALLSKGENMPDGYPVEKPETVVYQCSEDGTADTIKPRLIAAGAHCNRVAYIVEEDKPLTLNDTRLEKAIAKSNAKLLIIDPIQSYIGQDGDMQSASRMRNLIGGLASIAAKYNCAVILIGHLNKQNSGKNLYRGLGSIDIAATARSILMVARDDDESDVRYVFHIKSSLAPEGDAIRFAIGKPNGFRWLEKSIIKNINAFLYPHKDSKKVKAKQYLIKLLEYQDISSVCVFEILSNLGISKRTVKDAKCELKIKSYKANNSWYWHYEGADKEV